MTNQTSIFKGIIVSIFCAILSHLFTQTIASGDRHSLAICTDGTVQAWGDDASNQLGAITNFMYNFTPVQVMNLSGVISVEGGDYHSMALKSDGTLWTWGDNMYGQLGDGTHSSDNIPVQISGNWNSISAGSYHSFGIKDDGSLWAWGRNMDGQLGDGTNIGSNIPVQIPGYWTSISTGFYHSIGIKDDGTLWAWGNNLYGQLGIGTNNSSNIPVQIPGYWNSIFVGSNFSLGIKTDGTLWAWGDNSYGQFGDGTLTASNIPVQIPNYWNSISIGDNYTLAIKTDGTLWAWGGNNYGQLGDGTYTRRTSPVQIAGSWTSISGGYHHSVGLKADGTLWTWGTNGNGQLGDGTLTDSNIPVQTIQLCPVLQPTSVKGIKGNVFLDFNENCIKDGGEQGLANRLFVINPGNIIVRSKANGSWSLDSLSAGSYTITIDTSNTNWTVTCPITQSFTVVHSDSLTIAPSFGMVANNPCPSPNVSVNMPFIRPCFTNQQIRVQACNEFDATGILPDAYSIVTLDPNLIFESASLPYTSLGNNRYRFEHDTLNPGQCVNYAISAQVNCDAPLGLTLCMEASLYPVTDCVLDSIPTPPTGEVLPCTLPWDKSSLKVEGNCINDSIVFTITNTGEPIYGDMDCYSPVRLFIDGQYIWLDSIKLVGGETFTYRFSGDGRTWRLEADQHPLHPGKSFPNSTIERCGNSANWTNDLVNILPHDDKDLIKDIYCGIVTGSYDPNDKRGFPLGIGSQHLIEPNNKVDYVIRFQNTGTDTAFTVVVRDTLDTDLNIFSVNSGVSSHPYSFKMYGPRVLEWTFNNILLPDSTTNEPLSNGFVSFSVDQEPNLIDGTEINNKVGIYFDFNEPVITNTTSHIIGRPVNQISWAEEKTIYLEACEEVTYNNYTYNKSGKYLQVVEGVVTDTLLTINVKINSTASSSFVSACSSYTAPDGMIYNQSGLITAIIPNSVGCDSTILLNLTINPLANISVTTVNNTSTCGNSDGSISINGTGSGTLTWTGHATGSQVVTLPYTLTNLSAGNYNLNFDNGCPSTSILATVSNPSLPPTPTVSNSGALTFCEGESVILSSSATTGNSWTGGGTAQNITVNSSGTYVVNVTQNGCVSANSTPIVVTVNPIPAAPFLSASGPTTFCAGESVTLSSDVTSGIVWSPNGETSASITTSDAGTYFVTVMVNGCSNTSSAVTTTVNPLPTPSIASIADVCDTADVIGLNQGSPAGGVYTVNGTTATSFTPNAGNVGVNTIEYSLTQNNCTGTASTSITVIDCSTGVGLTETTLTFKLFPNPTTGIIEISGIPSEEIASIKVYDQVGKLILTDKQNNNINLTSFARGIYTVHLKTSRFETQHKIELIK